MRRWFTGCVLVSALTLVPVTANGAPLRLQFAWDVDFADVFSLTVLYGAWPAGLVALVDLDGSGIDLPGDAWCGTTPGPPDNRPAGTDFAFCSSFLLDLGSDELPASGDITLATLYLGTVDSYFDVYAESRSGEVVVVDYPVPEPAMLALMGVGFLGLGSALRKRRPLRR